EAATQVLGRRDGEARGGLDRAGGAVLGRAERHAAAARVAAHEVAGRVQAVDPGGRRAARLPHRGDVDEGVVGLAVAAQRVERPELTPREVARVERLVEAAARDPQLA